MLRVVVDTNVIVSASLWAGTPATVLSLARDAEIRIFTSEALLDELRKVLRRSKFVQQLKRTGRTADDLHRDYQSLAQRVPVRRFTRQIARDTDDDMVLACALF
ncbi:MAG: putative toxin-antitoxin system toxin component, PIN family [Betaproteobacteria bacterium]